MDRRIEQTITRDLIAPSEADLYAKHDLDALLRADLQTRYNAHKVGIEAGFLTRNEARNMKTCPRCPDLMSHSLRSIWVRAAPRIRNRQTHLPTNLLRTP